MPESATTPSAPRPLTDAQRRAIFAAARARGLSIEDLRTMTPQHSIRQLDTSAAAELLERLNDGGPRSSTSPTREHRSSASPRRPRAAPGVIRLPSDEQLALLVSIRMELGWTQASLEDFLAKRHGRESGKPMWPIETSRDAVDVIELLKHVRNRTLRAREGAAPHPRQILTIKDRLARLARAQGRTLDQVKAWAYQIPLKNGRTGRTIATSADASELIEALTRELAKSAPSQISNLKSKEPAQ